GFGHWVTNGVGILRIQVIHAQFVPGEQVLSAEINPEILDSHAVEPRFGEGVADFSITQSGKRLVHNEEVVGYVVGVAQGTQSRVGNFFSIFVALPGPGSFMIAEIGSADDVFPYPLAAIVLSLSAKWLGDDHQTNALVVGAERKTGVDTSNTCPADSHLIFVILRTISV